MTKMIRESVLMICFTFIASFFNYLYQVMMGRLLSPEEYGILFSLISVSYVIGILSATTQTTATMFVSRLRARNETGKMRYLWFSLLKKALIFGFITTSVLMLIVPLLADYLHISSYLPAAVLFSSIILAYALPVNFGILRGNQRFLSLGISQISWAFLKFLLAVILVYYGFGVVGALLPFLIANVVTFILTFFLLKDLLFIRSEPYKLSGLYRYSSLTLLALLAYTMAYSVDVILARHYLQAFMAGVYASLSVLGKIILFAPGGIAVVLFPKTSELSEKGMEHFSTFLRSLALAALLVIPILLAYEFFPGLIVKLIFGEKYLPSAAYLSTYGLAMFLFAIAGLSMNYLLSLGKTKVAYFLAAALSLEILGIMLFHENIEEIVSIMVLTSILFILVQIPFLLWYGKKKN
ncbi:MAG TPA: polysaccharide biosynthesis protein [Candidatus Altiarchaeales archaeon]|nr:polysaccharide biosynthesis protein [Candidatus Altiarchaeales archaeon]